jgi:hypothetical protein
MAKPKDQGIMGYLRERARKEGRSAEAILAEAYGVDEWAARMVLYAWANADRPPQKLPKYQKKRLKLPKNRRPVSTSCLMN